MAEPQVVNLSPPKPVGETNGAGECCGNCSAFYPQPKMGAKLGQCRRNAPTPLITAFRIEQTPDGATLMLPARGVDGAWPLTGVDLHCQQYKHKSVTVAGTSQLLGWPPKLGDVSPLKDGEQ